MKKYFLAISRKDAEFLYKINTAILVPEKSADKIAEFLNSIKYWIKDENTETWFKHENDFYTDERIDKEITRFSKRFKIYRR